MNTITAATKRAKVAAIHVEMEVAKPIQAEWSVKLWQRCDAEVCCNCSDIAQIVHLWGMGS